jgi:D-glycero-D-manno-heptose 1,7-bisphosphate phosphatase
MLDLQNINREWTLFLDRDGVINHEKENDYVLNTDEFVLYEGVLESLPVLAANFGRIIIVTNQRGVGKGLMTEEDLHSIHELMEKTFKDAGANIDRIYYCTSLDNLHPNRKPQHGMALLAKADFEDIDFSRSVMVGNNMSDMLFGRNAGMHTVFLKTTSPDLPLPDPAIDLAFNNLLNFAQALPAA